MINARGARLAVALAAAVVLAVSANGAAAAGATSDTIDDTTSDSAVLDDPCSPATGSDDASAPEASAPPSSSADDDAAVPGGFLPDIDVVRVACGDTVALRSLAAPDVPTLLWFWAPHCTFCMREAPEVVEFSAEYGDDVRIIGLGAQDSLDQAVDFVSSTGTEGLVMVWDATGESWIHFEVTSQPTVIVLSADGEVEATWYRDFDEAGILAAAGVT